MTVTFCGHSSITNKNEIENWLEEVVGQLIDSGANKFYLGGYGDFDRLCFKVLSKYKNIYPVIELLLVVPYINHNMSVEGYDGTIYPDLETVPLRYAILKRNQWMVEVSDCVVAYVTRNIGGASKTLEYAKRKKKNIIVYKNKDC